MYLLQKALLALSTVALAATWVRCSFPGQQPGWQRLLRSMPVLFVAFSLPRLFNPETEFLTLGVVLLLVTWLGTFKTLAYAINRGPLAYQLTYLQFLMVFGLPITPQEQERSGSGIPKVKSNARISEVAGTKATLLKKYVAKTTALIVLSYLLTAFKLPRLIDEFLKAFVLYFFLGSMMDGPGAVLTWIAGLPCCPHFDSPWRSTSLSNFWGQRWNLTVGNVLRALIYDPIHEGRLVKEHTQYKHNRLRTLLATCATFLVSGIMHELILWYILGYNTGYWFIFFTLQGPMLAAEALLKRWCSKHNLEAPPWLAVLATLSTLMAVADWSFFPAAVETGLDERFFASIQSCISAVVQMP